MLLLVVASTLTLWPRPVSTRTATPPQAAADDWDPQSGKLDLSAHERAGVASFYASSFFWRRMANGEPMDPHGSNAASRTLPLGTVARVTDVDTGKSALIKIADRGPYAKGRIVDLSPSTARKIGITQRLGVAKVVVTPITVPLPGGGVKVGEEARQNELRLAATLADTKASP